MMINPAKTIRGKIALPGDKSISHRAAMLAAIGSGESRIENFAPSADCASTLDCLRKIGVRIEQDGSSIIVDGVGPHGFTTPTEPLDCGNSGTTMRLLAGLLAGQGVESVLIGDESLSKRPMLRVIEPLTAMGAQINSDNGKAPLRITGGHTLHGITHEMNVASAQVKSAILLASLGAEGVTSVLEPVPTRDHTERMLTWFGAVIDRTEDGQITIEGGQTLDAGSLRVPGDISSAAFFLAAAACLEGSELLLTNVGLNPTRTGIIDVLVAFGVDVLVHSERIDCNEPVGDLTVRSGLDNSPASNLLSGDLVANMIDEIPILAVLGTRLAGGLEVRDAAELRVKESDRISSVVENLRRMGAGVEEFDDGFRVARSELRGANLDSFGDHRIAMAFGVAGLIAEGDTEIRGATCVDISFPGFFQTLQSVVIS